MPDAAGWMVLIGAALVGSTVGGVAGFGAGVIVLPVVAWTLGIRAAVPVMTVTMLLGNLSRLWWSRGDTDYRVAGRFLAGAIPATALGTALFAAASSDTLARTVGLFLLAAVPLRRLLAQGRIGVRLGHFPALGGVFGLLSAVVVTTGPVVTPFFLAYGLRRGSYLATEATCALAMHLTRGAALARYSLLTSEAITVGLVLGATMFAGAWLGRRLLDRMSDRAFLVAVEALLVVMGLQFLLFPR